MTRLLHSYVMLSFSSFLPKVNSQKIEWTAKCQSITVKLNGPRNVNQSLYLQCDIFTDVALIKISTIIISINLQNFVLTFLNDC